MKLAVASQSSVLLSMKMPRGSSQKEVTAYMGHNSSIRQVSFSHGKTPEYSMLTSSMDGTARMWKSGRVESSSIVFSHYLHQCNDALLPSSNPSIPSATSNVTAAASLSGKLSKKTTSSRNRPFADEIKSCQFFFQDKFVLLVSRRIIHLIVFYDRNL